MTKKLKVLMIPTLNSGVVYWRMQNFWAAAYRQNLAEFHVLWYSKKLTELHPWETDLKDAIFTWRITKEIQDYALQADVIVFQMLHTYDSLELFRALKELCPNKPILTEIDDNMISTPTYNPADPFYQPGSHMRDIAISQFKESDGIITTTPYLADVYAEYNQNVNVVHNAIDFEVWDRVRRRNKPGIRIGWAGGATHEEDLRLIEPIVENVVKNHKDVSFVFVHGLPYFLRGKPGVEHYINWTHIHKYPQTLANLDFDIGIAPLVDNAFNRGKSNLRWLEYSALVVPTVASKVGHFAQTINDGVDGFLADSEKNFESCLEYLIRDRKARKEMGQEANRRLRADFNVDRVVKDYIYTLERAIAIKAAKETEGVCQ